MNMNQFFKYYDICSPMFQAEVERAKTKLMASTSSAWTDVETLKATQQRLAGQYDYHFIPSSFFFLSIKMATIVTCSQLFKNFLWDLFDTHFCFCLTIDHQIYFYFLKAFIDYFRAVVACIQILHRNINIS